MGEQGTDSTGDNRTLYVRRVPDVVWVAAKVAAARRGISLREWIIEAVEEKSDREVRNNSKSAQKGGDLA